MRVMLLAQFYPPDIGGEERHVQALARGLVSRGHDVVVITQALTGTPSIVDEDGIQVHRVRSTAMRLPRNAGSARPHAPPLPDPELARAIARIADVFGPDVVHAHNWIVNSAVTLRNIPILLTLHDYGHVCPTQRMMHMDDTVCPGPSLRSCPGCSIKHYGTVTGLATCGALRATRPLRARRVAKVLAVSRAVAHRNGLDRGRTPWAIVPNFIPATLLDESEHRPDPALPSGPYVIFVGDQTYDKGLPVLLEAFARRRDRTLQLVSVGAGADPDVAHPEGVHAVGSWPHDRVMNALRGAVAAVVPSTWPDPCPTTVLEAMAAGTPLIASSVGGVVDMVVDGVSGLLVAPSEPQALVAALDRLTSSDELRGLLAAGARERVSGFVDDSVVPRLVEVYESLLGAPVAVPT